MHIMRANGCREPTTRELKIIERLWVGGHTDKQIGDMIGRTTRSVHGIRSRRGLTEKGAECRANAWFSAAEDQRINQRISDWVENERLSCHEMSDRLKRLHPPGLHLSTISKRITQMGSHIVRAHRENMQGRKSRRTQRMHKNGGSRTQPRANGKWAKKGVADEPGRDSETAQRT